MKKIVVLSIVALFVLAGCTPATQVDVADAEEPMAVEEAVVTEEAMDAEESMESEETMESEEAMATEESQVDESIKPIGVEDIELELNKKAPDFTLDNVNDMRVSLSDYEGQYVIVTFWATWCTYCKQELPHLDALDSELEDFKVLAVNQNESKSKVEKYLNEEGFGLEVLLDTDGMVGQKYMVQGLPTNYFFDKEGNLISSYPGMLTEDDLVKVVEYIRENF